MERVGKMSPRLSAYAKPLLKILYAWLLSFHLFLNVKPATPAYTLAEMQLYRYGRFVAFHTAAWNLTDFTYRGYDDVVRKDSITGTTVLVSDVNPDAVGHHQSYDASVSGGGRSLAYVSGSSNIVRGDSNNVEDIFVKDMLRNVIARVSVNSDGNEGNGASMYCQTSKDGSYIAFQSESIT